MNMDVVDLHDPQRLKKTPDKVAVLFSDGQFIQDEFTISRVELRLYCERIDEKLGIFSLVTSFVQTSNDSIEMIYDEGFRGSEPLLRAADFITNNLGLSALILRSIISLRQKIKES